MTEKTIKLRINKNGDLHLGDIRRLTKVQGTVKEVVMPDVPKGNAARVTITLFEEGKTFPGDEGFVQRPISFHP